MTGPLRVLALVAGGLPVDGFLAPISSFLRHRNLRPPDSDLQTIRQVRTNESTVEQSRFLPRHPSVRNNAERHIGSKQKLEDAAS